MAWNRGDAAPGSARGDPGEAPRGQAGRELPVQTRCGRHLEVLYLRNAIKVIKS